VDIDATTADMEESVVVDKNLVAADDNSESVGTENESISNKYRGDSLESVESTSTVDGDGDDEMDVKDDNTELDSGDDIIGSPQSPSWALGLRQRAHQCKHQFRNHFLCVYSIMGK